MTVARGLEGVIANTTRLSDVIGDKGQLVYCGYDINELAGKVSYKEVVYLLWHNKLPNRMELEAFCSAVKFGTDVPCTAKIALAAAVLVVKANEAIRDHKVLELGADLYNV
jgi:citrate synthase